MRGGHGVHLGHNERVTNLELEVLSDHWYVLRKATFDFLHRDGSRHARGPRGVRPRQRRRRSCSTTRTPGRCC